MHVIVSLCSNGNCPIAMTVCLFSCTFPHSLTLYCALELQQSTNYIICYFCLELICYPDLYYIVKTRCCIYIYNNIIIYILLRIDEMMLA